MGVVASDCFGRLSGKKERTKMKNWICYNLFGEHPDDVDVYGMVLGLGIQGFLVFWAVYLFIYIPFFVAG